MSDGHRRQPVTPAEGWGVVHLFLDVGAADPAGATAAVDAAAKDGLQVVTASLLGHKADVAVIGLGPDLWRLRDMQDDLVAAGCRLAWSYVSLTEVSEYAAGMPEEMKRPRLYPTLPPAGKPAFCFYPMSKRRQAGDNWYLLPYEERKELMYGHGAVGRTFAGRVLQLITGSTGLDDWEWGVTLFAERPDDLKAVVYTMRFDGASARYAEFGPFYTGMVAEPGDVFTRGRR